MYDAQVIADSISPLGVRLTTLEVTYPHAIHKDIMTHRRFSRSYKSFRAVPPEKIIAEVENDPFIPDDFASRVKGMGQGAALDSHDQQEVLGIWLAHRDHAVKTAREMLEYDLAKQQINFVLQDFAWITGIITATHWDNFWALRADVLDPASPPRPEVNKIARMMKRAHTYSNPRLLEENEWHIPYVDPDEIRDDAKIRNILQPSRFQPWIKVSAGRCGRVSYLTHDGRRDPSADLVLHDRLLANGHMGPFEHQATPMIRSLGWSGNFWGWKQYRKTIPWEDNFRNAWEGRNVN